MGCIKEVASAIFAGLTLEIIYLCKDYFSLLSGDLLCSSRRYIPLIVLYALRSPRDGDGSKYGW